MADAYDAAAAAGDLNPNQHAFYTKSLTAPLDNPGGVHNVNLNVILAHAIAAKTGSNVADSSGLISTGPRGSANGGPNGGDRPVQNVHHYNSAAATYQADLQDRIDAAERSGDTGLAAVLRNIRSVPEVVEKQRLAGAYLSSLEADPVARAKAKVAMGGRALLQGK
jgi:hypothetical protein